MKLTRHLVLEILLAACLCVSLPSHAQTGPKTLILYDAPPGNKYEKLGFAYAIMLRNLLGHFSASVDMLPVQQYTASKVNSYAATFYLGSYYDHQLPAAFLNDVVTTTKTVVWFKYNIWQLAWNTSITPSFAQRYGMSLTGTRGLNAAPTPSAPNPGFFDDVLYKNKEFIKYYTYDANSGSVNADPDIGVMQAVDTTKANPLVTIKNRATGEIVPYLMRSGNFWYVADMPFSYIGPRDRYLVIADLLHDILAINHAERHDGLVRLEDVGALVDVQDMKTLTDYLFTRSIPFSIAVIPHYTDPLGKYNNGIPQTIPLVNATQLKRALDYAKVRGGAIVEHGYTHQYSNIANPHSGVSADDFEFWLAVGNKPVPEDSQAWAAQRMLDGKNELIANGYTPFAWETPHYQASAKANRAATFMKTYQRAVYYTADTPNFDAEVSRDFAVGQFYPYVIQQDYYGQKIIPENLGNIEYDISDIDPTSNIVYTWQDLYLNAQFALAVRDGYGSFFFHPFWLEPSLGVPGFQDFQNLINGMKGLGYTWKAAKDEN